MFDGALDQAAGLRKLIQAGRPPLLAAGTLVPLASAQRFLQDFSARVQARGAQPRLVDRAGLLAVAEGFGPVRTADASGTAACHADAPWMAGDACRAAGASGHVQVHGVADLDGARLLWVDEPVAMARWVHAQAGDRLLLVLSQRREAMMAQYAEIKKIAASTGIRRFGVLFFDVDQVRQGRQSFLGLAGCARRFLSVQLDVVVSSGQDEPGLTMWSGLSTAELADFEWSDWSGAGLPLPERAAGTCH